MRKLLLSTFAALLVASSSAAAAPAAREVEIVGPRVHLGAIAPDAKDEADVDLGPTPAPGTSRAITRAQIDAARLAAGHAEPLATLPDVVRVVRKMRRLEAREIDAMTRAALARAPLARGATLESVNAPPSGVVPDGWTDVVPQVPRLPRRSGHVETVATLELRDDTGAPLARVYVPLTVDLPPEAAHPDCTRGSSVQLLVRRGSVEVSAPGVASADGDVGEVIPILVPATGHVLRAKLVARDRAVEVGP